MNPPSNEAVVLTSAAPAPRVWPIFVVLPVMLTWQFFTAAVMWGVLYAVDRKSNAHLMSAGFIWIGFMVLMWCSVTLGTAILSRHPREALGIEEAPRPALLLSAIAGGSAYEFCVSGAAYLTHSTYRSASFTDALLHASTGQVIGWLLLTAGVGSAAEELLLRGFVLRRLALRWNVAAALAVFAVVGAAEHFAGTGFAKLSNATYAVLAGLISWRRECTWYAVAFASACGITEMLQTRELLPEGSEMPILAVPVLIGTVAVLLALPGDRAMTVRARQSDSV